MRQMDLSDLKYPQESYRKVLTGVLGYYRRYPGVFAIVLTGSQARSKAVEGSCIDLWIFLHKNQLDVLPSTIQSRAKAYCRLEGEIAYYNGQVEGGIVFGDVRVDVGFTDGRFKAHTKNSFDITRDEFETTIGNLFVYARVLYEKGREYQRLRERYLPFYGDRIRKARLEGTKEEFSFKVWKTRWLAKRGEFYAALEAFLEAQRIFLQHLFIKERKYPIDYVKWLKEQFSDVLGMPNLYQQMVDLIDGVKLTENDIDHRCNLLEKLFLRHGSSTSKL